MRFLRQCCGLLCVLSVVSTGYANDTNKSGWQFVVAPYVWATNLNGNTQVGAYRVPVDQTFGDIVEKLNFAGMLYFSASKNKTGMFLDALYSQTSTNATDRGVTAKATNDYGIFTNAITYQAYAKYFNASHRAIILTPYVGARETINDTTINASFLNFSDSVSDNHTWADPILGMRLDLLFNANWSFVFFGDGGAVSSDNYTYRFEGLFGYKPTKFQTARFYLGYQLLKENYQTGSGEKTFAWNMNTFGPMLGVSFAF